MLYQLSYLTGVLDKIAAGGGLSKGAQNLGQAFFGKDEVTAASCFKARNFVGGSSSADLSASGFCLTISNAGAGLQG